MSIERLKEAWPEWTAGEDTLLGEGGFGKVYKASNNDGITERVSAIKIITIPKNQSEIKSLFSQGLNEGAVKTYFQGIVDDFVSEIKTMQAMKGAPNIVIIEDYKIIKNDGIGWDIFIRMEYLTRFFDYTSGEKFSENEVVKLGKDILTALESCAKLNIIHRDIKPDNILKSNYNEYKLGDFGIARELEKTAANMSRKGTFQYMAPEIMKSGKYDSTVDTYSLGLVLYQLLNNNRLPFLDPKVKLLKPSDHENAFKRRFSGEDLPGPINASESLTSVILKACSYNPSERFTDPKVFKQALEYVEAKSIPYNSINTGETEKKSINNKSVIYKIIIAAALLFILGTGGFYILNNTGLLSFGNTRLISTEEFHQLTSDILTNGFRSLSRPDRDSINNYIRQSNYGAAINIIEEKIIAEASNEIEMADALYINALLQLLDGDSGLASLNLYKTFDIYKNNGRTIQQNITYSAILLVKIAVETDFNALYADYAIGFVYDEVIRQGREGEMADVINWHTSMKEYLDLKSNSVLK